jgi:DNA invertase Pin-like site-specific DNA recombinase
MDRPALRQLLADIDAGRVDTVVVYKVDRLTRSLTDFAKIIERFDAREVSFVSVTQQFNTTTSMGRLTLNVLLSFAQFEREVTGERIRDKIAASKRKGMWMGGTVPLGYDLCDHKLIVNADESVQVQKIFKQYLDAGCVAKLKSRLDRDGVRSKVRIGKSGKKSGGTAYSRGALYCLLQNQIYLGMIPHREAVYQGEHQAIISQELWASVQTRLEANNKFRRDGGKAKSPSLLVGLLYDDHGSRFTPFHADRNGKRYRYYVSQTKIHHLGMGQSSPARIPARDIENIVCVRIQSLLSSPEQLLQAASAESDEAAVSKALIVAGKQMATSFGEKSFSGQREFLRDVIGRIVVHEGSLILSIQPPKLRELLLGARSGCAGADGNTNSDSFVLTIEAKVKRCGGEVRLIIPADSGAETARRPVHSLIKAIARVHQWPKQIISGAFKGRHSIAQITGIEERYAGRILQCAFLAPDIVEAILNGRQPANLTVQKLLKAVPLAWMEQRKCLGF